MILRNKSNRKGSQDIMKTAFVVIITIVLFAVVCYLFLCVS